MAELFKTPDDALVFAFRFSDQQYAISPMAKNLRRTVVGNGRGLVALDGAGQAGFVFNNVRLLNPIEQACIVCRYSERFAPCECNKLCCSGESILEEYKNAILFLDNEVALPSLTGFSHRIMRHTIIRHYFEKRDRSRKGKNASIIQTADQLKIPRRSAYDMKAKIEAGLIEHDKNARTRIHNLLSYMCGEQAA